MANKKFDHLVEELEEQFHAIHNKLGQARDNYLAKHEKDFDKAKGKVHALSAKLSEEKQRYTDALVAAKKSGSKKAANQLKKAKAAVSLLGSSLTEARAILSTAEDKLNSAKPFDRKLAAREKALKEFEKQWEKKLKDEAAAKAKRAAERKKQAAAKAAGKVQAKSAVKSKAKNLIQPEMEGQAPA